MGTSLRPSGKRFVVDEWRPWPLLTQRQIEESPSFKLGMSFKHEKKLREAACKVIGEAGKTLDQGIITIAIAQTYLVRFFAIKPYQRNDSFIVAVAALFVASKTENKPRALADIAHACWRHWVDLWVKEQKKKRKDAPASFWEQKGAAEKAQFRNPEFCKKLAASATTAERVLLYTTGFQFNVHTGFFVLLGSKNFLVKHSDPAVVQFFSELNLQIVWNFVIECYRSTRLCLRFDPRTIGIACYEMTCTHLKREIPLVDGDLWWRWVAKKMDWNLNAVGSPEDMTVIQDELWAIFKPSQARGANGAHTDGRRSAPGTPGPMSQPELPPAKAQHPSSASGPSPRPAVQQPAAARQSGAAPLSNGRLPHVATAPKAAPSAARTNGGHAAPAAMPAAAEEREEGEVRFSPSDEFSASPRGSAPDDSAQTSAPTLLGLESGELVLEQSEPTARPDAAAQQARLAKVRAAMEKRKAGGVAGGRPPDAKRARSGSPLS